MPEYIALIPAAGFGSRMGSDLPKQYLPLHGKPMIFHAINRLCQTEAIRRVYVVLSPQDNLWNEYDWRVFTHKLTPLYCGGETRAESVLKGLLQIADDTQADDWILVHDAARPCLTADHVSRLIEDVGDDQVGGLLAVPVADTLKRADEQGRVVQTKAREGLWQAQTPQMFRYGILVRALQALGTEMPTDDARAVEHLGLKPKLVACDSRNLKVTYPQDLQLAELILQEGTV